MPCDGKFIQFEEKGSFWTEFQNIFYGTMLGHNITMASVKLLGFCSSFISYSAIKHLLKRTQITNQKNNLLYVAQNFCRHKLKASTFLKIFSNFPESFIRCTRPSLINNSLKKTVWFGCSKLWQYWVNFCLKFHQE